MNFTFNVNLSEKDYLDYNVFWQMKSPYGKNNIILLRIYTAVLFVVAAFIFWMTNHSLSGVVFIVLIGVISELLSGKFYVFLIKSQIKSLSKKGKTAYSASSIMEFSEDGFSETTKLNKTEQKYSAVERISIIGGETVYIHVNNIMSYILPKSCFESKEQFDSFLNFIKTKCNTVDNY